MVEEGSVKMKNPLIKRIPRELLGEWRKYLVVSLFLILTIGFVSGMYVANESMMTAAEEGISEYRLESGHFELREKADEEMLSGIASGERADIKQYYLDQGKKELDEKFDGEAYQTAYPEARREAYDEAWKEVQEKIEEKYAEAEEKYELNDSGFETVPVLLYENFYRNEEEDSDNDGIADGTVRVYAKTEEVNLACLMEGSFPVKADEIAIDRMHADNAGIQVGDAITVGGEAFRVTGLLAYVNYATLHEKSTDLIFDAIKFDVAMATEEGFGRLQKSVHYAYAWRYEEEPADEKEEKKRSDDFLKVLLTNAVVGGNEIEDYLPRYANPAIQFATDDMGSDEAMGGVLLNILIVIIAFIFAITISNTIAREARTIGTLRASGYSRGELIRHYLAMPVIVTFLAAGVGNLLGYSVFKNVVVSMYYNSYSLPTYKTIWNPEAFVKTTLIPVGLMFVVNLVVIGKMMRHTPLEFLRRDLKKKKRKKAIRLPSWRFFSRFRLRILFQNMSNYAVLFIGVLFIMVLLAMAVGMPDTLAFYKENAADLMFAKYQYVLKSCEDEDGNPIHTKQEEAEKFGMRSLLRRSDAIDEEVSVYGISDGSRYVEIAGLASLSENEAYISESFREKYRLEIGDTVSLEEKYENKRYSFQVAGIYDRCQSIAVFLSMENYRSLFELEEGEFSGYLSDSEITDLEEGNIATVITERDITKMCDQLDHSMGAYMQYFQYLCILLSAVLIYLLTKIIIEKNENAISMVKILGYENREIASLYLLSTTIVLVFADAVSVVLGSRIMALAWESIMSGYSGWFTFAIKPAGYVKMFAFVLIGYLLVMVFDFKRIKRIPMDEALKNVE
ncbi:MAG: ABC transporter permease [Roseburia sp.]|nr:ABC transporter permease [Roseburia sp.]MCM1099344.1 ABC transporter permease [Ruminococcus flavefaciens]